MLIPTIILTSCVIVGAHIAADELAYTFTDGAKGIGDLLPYKWAKPVIACPTCMASIWGSVSFFLFGDALLDWPIIVLACAFTNTLFNKWVN